MPPPASPQLARTSHVSGPLSSPPPDPPNATSSAPTRPPAPPPAPPSTSAASSAPTWPISSSGMPQIGSSPGAPTAPTSAAAPGAEPGAMVLLTPGKLGSSAPLRRRLLAPLEAPEDLREQPPAWVDQATGSGLAFLRP
jgi:hypothetical protein